LGCSFGRVVTVGVEDVLGVTVAGGVEAVLGTTAADRPLPVAVDSLVDFLTFRAAGVDPRAMVPIDTVETDEWTPGASCGRFVPALEPAMRMPAVIPMAPAAMAKLTTKPRRGDRCGVVGSSLPVTVVGRYVGQGCG
jgi:hypothetical protein